MTKLTSLNQIEKDGKTFEGQWQLDPNHELLYRERRRRKEARLKGTLVAAEAEALVFSATVQESEAKTTTRLFKLTGDWRVDAKNRIVFEVEREAGKKDTLTFQGSWELGPYGEIVYSYETVRLRTKTKRVQRLVFKGQWDLSERRRLAFLIEGDTDSALRFRGAFQTQSILAKDGEIRYQIGVEASGRRRIQTLVFFGKWKISRQLELSFEIEYAGGRKHALVFGGTYFFRPDMTIEVKLRAREGMPLGVEVIFTRDFFAKEGQLFLRLRKTAEETAGEVGVRVRF